MELDALCDAAPDLLGKVAAIFEPKTTFSDYDALLADRIVDFDIFFGLLRSVGFDGPLIMHGFDEDEALESMHFARAKLREANANVLH